MDERKLELQCTNCGQAFWAFLRDMAEHNATIVCPACDKVQDREHILEVKTGLRKGAETST